MSFEFMGNKLPSPDIQLAGADSGDCDTDNLDKIIRVVADYYKITEKDLLTYKKTRENLLPRQIAMYLSRTMTKASFPVIGRKFADTEYAVIIYACEKIERKKLSDKKLADTIDILQEKISQVLTSEKII